MIPDNRAERMGDNYLEDGKQVVVFNPKLTLEEWKFLQWCQTKAHEKDPQETDLVEKTLLEAAKKKKAKHDSEVAKKRKKDDEHTEKLKKDFNR